MPLSRALLPLLALLALGPLRADESLLREALAAEARLDSQRALELFLQLQPARPTDAFVAQKIAQQYSDLIVDLPDVEEKKRHARLALEWSERAVQLDPRNAVAVLSLAVCHGKLATYSDTRTKVKYSRLVRQDAERALALDPNYAWAHHVLGRWHREVAELSGTARFFVKLFYGGLPDASLAEAVNHLEKAVALEPEVPSHAVELGFAYAAAGRSADARRSWERSLQLPPRLKHDAPAQRRARAALEALP
jgi:tetratricopeptide (TPR) repeat protein